MTQRQLSLATTEQCAGPIIGTDYKEPQCIALDGDKLKPREDQRKGGNGFGINEEGVGYTLTSVDRHGCAYKVSSTGKDVASTLSADDGTRTGQDYKNNSVVEAYRIDPLSSNSMKSSNPDSGIHQVESAQTLDTTVPTPAKNQGGDVVVECFENHPHDSRIKSTGDCCQTITQKCGTGGGNLPLVVTGMAQNTRDEVRIVGDGNVAGCLAAEPGMKQQTYVVSQGVDGYNQKLTGDVVNTIGSCGPDINHIQGVVTKSEALSVNFEMYDVGKDVNVSLCAKRAHDCMVVTDESMDASDPRRS